MSTSSGHMRPPRGRWPGRRGDSTGIGLSDRELGRLGEKVRQTEARLRRLEDEVYQRKRQSGFLAVTWRQVIVTGLFLLVGSLGSAALVILAG